MVFVDPKTETKRFLPRPHQLIRWQSFLKEANACLDTESYLYFSVADPDPGSGIRDWVLFDPWIRDPESGIGLFRIPDPGSRIPDLGSRIPNSYF